MDLRKGQWDFEEKKHVSDKKASKIFILIFC